ncbi:hypothetical protein E3N88_39461 [Mikania micrantha]|uniref:Uncharacterized protein n=1 Tax=Mikania micrantha TaxID=192012 RepID=A0A5N6LWU5_9ASTR|nr:hypothetical protein E3N88_39461 [Mikania micrantha]
MGFDGHRIRLDKQKGKMVGYELVFIDTHATKETKKRLRDGEINVNDLDELEFVTSRSKESFKEFHNELVKEYEPNNDQNYDRDELAVWERLHSNNRGQMFGIGSSDPRFVVTGSQSSCGSISYGDARQSQKDHMAQSNPVDLLMDRGPTSELCDHVGLDKFTGAGAVEFLLWAE